MKIFLATFAVFAVAMIGMAAGVILSKRRLRGTCGGLSEMKHEHGDSMCDACTTPSETCTEAGRDQRDPEANASHSLSSETPIEESAV